MFFDIIGIGCIYIKLNIMQKVSIIIENDLNKSKSQTFIAPITEIFEGETLKKAVGNAMLFAARTINSQYDAPRVVIADVVLTDAHAKKFKLNFWDFQVQFGNIREAIMAQLAFTSEDTMVEYMRNTDVNGIFKNVKSFSPEQVAAQAKQQLSKVRDITRFIVEDAKNSVLDERVEERRKQVAEAAKLKRIAAKSQALIS
jgi:predicted component of type VI protein secretion system